MTYRGYEIIRELKGWIQNELEDDGSIGDEIGFVDDPDESAWYCVTSPEDGNGEALSSLDEAKAWIDWRLDADEGTTFRFKAPGKSS